MNIDIEALGGQRNLLELGALLVAFGGRGLGLVLGFDGGVGHALDGLLFLVAGHQREGQKQAHGQNSSETGTGDHEIKDSRAEADGLEPRRCASGQRAPGHGAARRI